MMGKISSQLTGRRRLSVISFACCITQLEPKGNYTFVTTARDGNTWPLGIRSGNVAKKFITNINYQ